ncbi:MAG: glycosyltransferase [Candidatus Paceibacterota bacterium]
MKRKKKILFLITKANFGGAQKYVYDLATSLPSEKFDVAVAYGEEGLLVEKLKAKSIRTIRVGGIRNEANWGALFSAFSGTYRVLVQERPDILHLNSTLISIAGACIGRMLAVPHIIFTIHGWAFNEERPLWQKLLIRFFAWLTLLFSHKAIAVSNAIRNEAPGLKQKIQVIHNGVALENPKTREEAREFLSQKTNGAIKNNSVVVGSVAELHPIKGLGYVIAVCDDLIQKFPDFHFVIFGEGENRPYLEKMISERNLKEHVHLCGFVDNAPSYLLGFDIFILPSISEALSLSILEAGALGLPVIASEVGGIPEIIEHEKTGLLTTPRDTASIQSAIEKLINDKKMAQQLGIKLTKKIEENFSKEKMFEKTIPLYEN